MSGAESLPSGEVTRLLRHYAEGDDESLGRVIPIVYEELKSLAHSQLRKSGVRGQMQTTMLVHEAYEKLAAGQTQDFAGRRHFFAIASRAMRQIVVDTYRRQMSAKRGGGIAVEELNTRHLAEFVDPERLLRLDQALDTLGKESSELSEIVDLACFGGFSTAEIADIRDEDVRTVQRKLKRAKAWLGQLLDGED